MKRYEDITETFRNIDEAMAFLKILYRYDTTIKVKNPITLSKEVRNENQNILSPKQRKVS